MSYSISYGPEKRTVTRHGKKNWGIILCTAILSAAALFVWLKPAEAVELQHRLFPWTQPWVREAFSVFTERVSGGEPLEDAFGEFCRDILHEG